MEPNLKLKLQSKISESFSLKPYPSQLDLACDIYECLASGKIGIFESPTGTGKSFALIEAVMNYLEDVANKQVIKEPRKIKGLPDWFCTSQEVFQPKRQPQKLNKETQGDVYDYDSEDDRPYVYGIESRPLIAPQAIYTTRTHSQLKQFVAEIKKSKHKPKIVTLGSRSQLCCNSTIIKESKGNTSLLNHLCKLKRADCPYFKNYKKWCDKANEFQGQIYDIEDLVSEGERCSSCPYYVSKALVPHVDIICMPYQLLMDQIVKIEQPIVLVDEAHNFTKSLLEIKSSQLTKKNLDYVIQGLNAYITKYKQACKERTIQLLNKLQYIAISMQKLQNIEKPMEVTQYMQNIGFLDVEFKTLTKFLGSDQMKQKVSWFIDNLLKTDVYGSFQIFCKFISTLLITNPKDLMIYGQKDVLFLSAISNETQFKHFNDKCKNIILIGGTLQPLNEYKYFEQYKDEKKFIFKDYPHIIEKDRCSLHIITTNLNYSFAEKQTQQNQILDQTIIILKDIAMRVPQGIVIFLQSYQFLDILQKKIKITEFKQKLFFDDRQKQILSQYTEHADQGAILISVVGGQLSEGINFSDGLARAVVVFGVPFPNTQSVELQEQIKRNGKDYYENITMRSVNQSIGRVIRHANDYGILILVDRRFVDLKGRLSNWLQDRIVIQDKFECNFKYF